jgi:hypothetical protein
MDPGLSWRLHGRTTLGEELARSVFVLRFALFPFALSSLDTGQSIIEYLHALEIISSRECALPCAGDDRIGADQLVVGVLQLVHPRFEPLTGGCEVPCLHYVARQRFTILGCSPEPLLLLSSALERGRLRGSAPLKSLDFVLELAFSVLDDFVETFSA